MSCINDTCAQKKHTPMLKHTRTTTPIDTLIDTRVMSALQRRFELSPPKKKQQQQQQQQIMT